MPAPAALAPGDSSTLFQYPSPDPSPESDSALALMRTQCFRITLWTIPDDIILPNRVRLRYCISHCLHAGENSLCWKMVVYFPWCGTCVSSTAFTSKNIGTKALIVTSLSPNANGISTSDTGGSIVVCLLHCHRHQLMMCYLHVKAFPLTKFHATTMVYLGQYTLIPAVPIVSPKGWQWGAPGGDTIGIWVGLSRSLNTTT